jgi:hypothetical protein
MAVGAPDCAGPHLLACPTFRANNHALLQARATPLTMHALISSISSWPGEDYLTRPVAWSR